VPFTSINQTGTRDAILLSKSHMDVRLSDIFFIFINQEEKVEAKRVSFRERDRLVLFRDYDKEKDEGW